MSNFRKALSIRQPWAWLIVNGYKDIENRSWPTKFRGRFFVQAGQKFDVAGYEWVKRHFPKIKLPERYGFFQGCVIGAATLTDCVTESRSPWFEGENYGFVLAEPTVFSIPVVHKGQLGFFDIHEKIAQDLLRV